MVARVVRPLSKDPAHLQLVYQKMNVVPNFLTGASWEAMLRPDFVAVEVDNVGIIALDLLLPGGSARGHITFWDRKLRGRELLCRRVAEMWAERYNLPVIFTAVPIGARTVVTFCTRIGFKATNLSDGFVHMVMNTRYYLHRANSKHGGD